jgi:Ca2+-binding EF-hand superfamily protein
MVLIRAGIVLATLCFISISLCEPKPAPIRHADKNKDGVVDKKEIKMEKQWEHKQRAKVNTWWEDRADTNNDGKVDAQELASWKQLTKERIDLNNDGQIDAKERRLCWQHTRSKVNTPVEKKYDKNGNGWLEPEEAKEMLKDKYTLIQTQGKAKVDTQLEKEYDTNSDGVIDKLEAVGLKGDLQQ